MYLDTVLKNVVRQLKSGQNVSTQAMLNVTVAGALYFISIAIPDTASVARIYSNVACRVCLSQQPLAIATTTFAVGAILNVSEWGTFALDNGIARTLQLASTATGIANIDLE